MNPYIIPACALGFTIFAALVGGLITLIVKAFKIGGDVAEIKKTMEQTALLAGYVPAMWWDVEYMKRHLSISTPQMPNFIHGHDAEE